jgi:chromosome partitioning protein
MKIVAVAAAKGGVGKSTLAAALATAASIDRPHAEVGLADLDPQGSLTHWWNVRAEPFPILYDLLTETLPEQIARVRDDRLDLLVLDCPPGFSDILKQAIAVADLVIVPTGPSDLDLTAVISTVFMAQEAGVPYRLVLNGVLSRSRLAREAVPALQEWGDLLCPPVHQRVAIATAMAWGSTAQETEPNGAAARELAALWPAVREVLKASSPRARRRPVGRKCV